MIYRRGALPPTLQLTSLRSAFRPGSSRLQTRQYLHTLVHTPRPWTWSERIWFRADGALRSKVRGLALASWCLGCLYVSWQTHSELASEESLPSLEEKVSATLVCQHRIDSEEYSSVDFSNYPASLDYFAHLYEAIWHNSKIDSKPAPAHSMLFATLASLDSSEDAKKRTKAYALPADPDDAERMIEAYTLALSVSEDAERRDKTHAIMREAAGTVHEILAAGQPCAIMLDAAETALAHESGGGQGHEPKGSYFTCLSFAV